MSNNLGDMFLGELARQEALPPKDRGFDGIVFLGRELAKRYKEQQETLASIAAMYVKEVHNQKA